MRTPVIAGNWKMNLDREGILALTRGIREAAGTVGVEIGVAPPFPYLEMVARELDGCPVWVAGQDMHFAASGAYTGDVSGAMLRDVGASHVILGHSERRHGWKESPELVGQKLRAALDTGLIPVLCIGETLEEREGGRMEAVLGEQLAGALNGVDAASLDALIVAYEPVWAIGTGVNASPAQAGESHAFVRGWFRQNYSDSFAAGLRIQYGGSVKPDNAADLMAVEDVDGALVGGASLKVEPFVGILAASGKERS